MFAYLQRKSEEADDESVKKAKQEEKGDGDAKVNGTTVEKVTPDLILCTCME